MRIFLQIARVACISTIIILVLYRSERSKLSSYSWRIVLDGEREREGEKEKRERKFSRPPMAICRIEAGVDHVARLRGGRIRSHEANHCHLGVEEEDVVMFLVISSLGRHSNTQFISSCRDSVWLGRIAADSTSNNEERKREGGEGVKSEVNANSSELAAKRQKERSTPSTPWH